MRTPLGAIFLLSVSLAGSTLAQDTFNVTLQDKTFIPSELTIKGGDSVTICNRDTFYHNPFSYSRYNQFGNPKGIRLAPDQCTTQVASNPTDDAIQWHIFDELHANEKLIITVSSSDGRKVSQRACTQPNVVGKYTMQLDGYSGGLLSIDSQSGNHIKGKYGKNETSLANTIEGDFSPDQCGVVIGTFVNNEYKSNGKISFSFNGSGFTGEWRHLDNSHSGSWSGKRSDSVE